MSDENWEQSEEEVTKSRKRNMSEDDDYNAEPKKKKKKSKKDKKRVKEEVDMFSDEANGHANGHVNGHVDSDEAERKRLKKERKRLKMEQEQNGLKSPKKEVSGDDVKASPKKKVKKEEPTKWKWWEEEKKALPEGHHWETLEHKGPLFAPPYERIPKHIKFYYDGEPMKLSLEAEEVMTFYAKMLDHDYTSKDAFNNNFFNDWREVMTHDEKMTIKKLSKCDFQKVHEYFKEVAEIRRNRSKEEKKAEKEEKDKLAEEYGFCLWDGHREKVGNFNIEPPGLFRGRGEHPKMGKLKKRVHANQIIINCSKGSKIPVPPDGQRWKEVRHDPTVTWLAGWTENVQGQNKYIMLNANSKIKGTKDLAKYERARALHKIVDQIRDDYRADLKSKEMAVRQRAVCLYFIDKLALRAGNEKDSEEAADTVGCCSLRVEHVDLKQNMNINGKDEEYVIVFDFLGKDSIRYYNEVGVEKRVWKNVGLFKENKKPEDDLFDRVDTSKVNAHLNSIMDGLTAKVFRTYNASITLQRQLKLLTESDSTVADKMLSYNRANREVAVLCNHQRAAPKNHAEQMDKIDDKIMAKIKIIKEKKKEVKDAKAACKSEGGEKNRKIYDTKKRQLDKQKELLHKLEVSKTDRDENKTISLGTSKLNYLDPRISVAWCKKFDVPIEKVYNKTQRDKFAWAIDMIMGEDDEFIF